MRESELEGNCRRYAEMHGCKLLKWVSPGNSGVPDRILVGGNKGVVWFLEFKKPKGGVIAPKQKWWEIWLRERGYKHAFITDIATFKLAVDTVIRA